MEVLLEGLLWLVLWLIHISFRRRAPREAAGRLAARMRGTFSEEGTYGRCRISGLTLGGRPAWIEYDTGNTEVLSRQHTRVMVDVRGGSRQTVPDYPEGFRRTLLRRGLRKPDVTLEGDLLTVSVRGYVTEEGQFLTLARSVEELAVALFGAPAIRMDDLKVSGEGRCPVCRTGLRGSLVRCEMCRAPHHEQCWSYMGRCSTYACRGRT